MERLENVLSGLQEFERIKVKMEGEVAIIYLNSIKELNSLTIAFMDQLSTVLKKLSLRSDIKCFLMVSKHPKVFGAGANIKEFKLHNLTHDIITDRFKTFSQTLHHLKKPLIVAVNGKALGGGFQLVLYADLILTGPNSEFAFPETGLGLIPGIGGTQHFAKIVGRAIASRYILTGEKITGKQLVEMKVASHYLEGPDFESQALVIAQEIAKKSNPALITAKRCIRMAQEIGLSSGLQFERGVFFPLYQTKGAEEGITSFLQKKRPDFTGK